MWLRFICKHFPTFWRITVPSSAGSGNSLFLDCLTFKTLQTFNLLNQPHTATSQKTWISAVRPACPSSANRWHTHIYNIRHWASQTSLCPSNMQDNEACQVGECRNWVKPGSVLWICGEHILRFCSSMCDNSLCLLKLHTARWRCVVPLRAPYSWLPFSTPPVTTPVGRRYSEGPIRWAWKLAVFCTAVYDQ